MRPAPAHLTPPTPSSARFDADGVTLRYLEAGAGTPVVLLHSYTGDAKRQFVDTGCFHAIAAGHRAIALDLRGHGGSGKPHEPSAYGPQLALDVVRLLDHLGLGRAHVVGYSLGAHVTAQLLTLAPSRVLSAVLGGAPGRLRWTAADDARVALEADEMEHGLLRAQIARLLPPGEPMPEEDEIRRRSRRHLAGHDLRALAALRRSNRDQVVTAAAIAAARVPLLGIVGSRDPYRARLRELAFVVPSMSVIEIDGATHANAAAQPQFCAAVLAFLHGFEHAR
jgi:pimeloyl-ACP methyl ester carboxylesterase